MPDRATSRLRLIGFGVLTLWLAACGGGGGGGAAAPPPPAPPPPPPPPPPAAGPTDPAVALARPISGALLCGNGLIKRAGEISSDQFVAAGASVGITHWHAVDDAVWLRAAGSIESVMRTGAVVVTELDDDCWPDLVFTSGATAAGQLVVYADRSGNGFSQRLVSVAQATDPIAGLGAADLDGDYRLDLALGNLRAGSMRTYRADGSGGFGLLQTLPMARSTFGFAFADYSGDDWLDVYAAHWDIAPPAADAPALLRNLGESTAAPSGTLVSGDHAAGTTADVVPHDYNLAPAFVDLDGDTDADLLIASDFGTSQVLLNGGTGDYSVAIASAVLGDENAAGQAVRDFDNDGHWDWFVASVHDPGDGRPWPWGTAGNRLYWGDAVSPYLTAADAGAGISDAEFPWGVCAEDFNNDGLVDLFVENGFGLAPAAVMASGDPFVQQINDSLYDKQLTRPRLFINQGGRVFSEQSAAWGLPAATNGRGVACFDYDRDGDIDIAVAENSRQAAFYENRHSAVDGGNFVALELVSIAPNSHAIGAVATVVAGGVTQRRRIGADSGFGGQQSVAVHFGLAAATLIDELTVRWPDGTVETLANLPVNRFMTLLDPRMLPYPEPTRDSRIAAAIGDALDYVANPVPLADDVLLGLSWMVRMHDITLAYAPGAELDTRISLAESSGDNVRARQLRTWRRSYDPASEISAVDYAQLSGFDAVTFAGVYCHQAGAEYPLDDSDIQALADAASAGAQGGYDTTHALLALLWAIDNDCAMPASYDPALLEQIVRDVYEIARAGGSSAVTDLRIEAMALLAAAGRHDLIQAAWVDQVLNAQLGNGGWKAAPADAEAFDHTTGLALWLLLQLAEKTKVLSGFVAQSWGA